MTNDEGALPVVVGIDGSAAASGAAIWAMDEAMSRDVPLRLIHCIDTGPDGPTLRDSNHLEIQYAEHVLREASAAVAERRQPLKVETDIVWGDPRVALVAEGDVASMVCVGSVGIGAFARRFLGSRAAHVAEHARCSVAVIRHSQDSSSAEASRVVVAVDHRVESERLLSVAGVEASMRHAGLVAVHVWRHVGDINEELDRRVDECRKQFPDVRVRTVVCRGSLALYLADTTGEGNRLAVIPGADASQVASIIGPRATDVFPHGECSVLVVR